MGIKDRLTKFLEHLQIGQKKFEVNAGLSNGFVNSLGNGISSNSITKIRKAYPQLNIDWLTNGEGEMLTTAKGKKKTPDEATTMDLTGQAIIHAPTVSQFAYGGYLSGFSDPEYIESLPTIPFIVDKEPKGTYVAFEVRGESMNDGSIDSIAQGDILICREIKRELWQSKLHIKKWDFVIVHRTKGIVIKRIANHNTNIGQLSLHSLNPEYEDFTVKIDDVMQIFNIVQVQRKRKQ